ncbi:MAG: hypothetical protein WBI63_07570 [Coriobacteriia bacterium]
MTKRIVLAALAALLIVSGVVGCGNRDGGAVDSSQAPVSTDVVESTSVTPAGDGSGDVSTGEVSADTAAIEAELSAIEEELGSMTMPSDSDFSTLEGDIN